MVPNRPTGPMAIAAGMAGNQIVDDGTTRWIYSPSKKQYAKQHIKMIYSKYGIKMEAYVCRHCGWWHVATKLEEKRK